MRWESRWESNDVRAAIDEHAVEANLRAIFNSQYGGSDLPEARACHQLATEMLRSLNVGR